MSIWATGEAARIHGCESNWGVGVTTRTGSRRIRVYQAVCKFLLWICVCECAGQGHCLGRGCVTARIEEHTGQELGMPTGPGQTTIPDCVEWRDGITEDEAISLALWNSPNTKSCSLSWVFLGPR